MRQVGAIAQGAGPSHPGLACGLRMRERKEYLRH